MTASTLLRLCAISLVAQQALVLASRQRYILNPNWKFELDGASSSCPNPNATFPINMNNKQCQGLSQATATSLDECIKACCSSSTCETYQWCEGGSCTPQLSCWIGSMTDCASASGWTSAGRNVVPPLPSPCSDPRCLPGTNDSAWRQLNLPHDFGVEMNFTESAPMSTGYLPYGIGWYRRHLTIPASAKGATIYVEFDGIQTVSTVWFNGVLLGYHASGYTASRYFLNSSIINYGGDNLLAVLADGTKPGGWWYDGQGIYRSAWLTIIPTPGPFIAPWGVYAPSQVLGNITWNASGAPFADSQLSPSVEVWSNATTTQTFAVALTVVDAAGNTVGTASGSGTVAPGAITVWEPSQPIAMPAAALWHLVSAPLQPALYTLQTTLSVGGTVVDNTTVTFGVRTILWDAASGFHLNGVPTKIQGNANHQDFAGLGVAIPDSLQSFRIASLKRFGGNGWRTAHNPPTPALLDAADALGFLVWDENHHNGQDSEVPLLIKRDRNHPCVVIWSLCNEVLCETNNTTGDALRLKALMKSLDPLGNRPVSANYNPFIGPDTPLDVQGFDYSTGNYDAWHAQAPNIPSISSETSSAVSDRDEYVNDPVGGHVSGYDNQYPGWGESAEQAWGGVGESKNQGILTRPFISGGWTWTGLDYKGEPTPYSWPDINSHFGIIDIAGFPKDRFFWYQAWFTARAVSGPVLHLLPHWNWNASAKVDVWAFSNVDAVELFVNGVSLGRQYMTRYSHIEWDSIPFVPGSIAAFGYVNGTAEPVVNAFRNTTGPAASLSISIKDGVGTEMIAGCSDVALVQVFVLDAAGLISIDAATNVTFTVSGPATFAGSGNGDPACHTSDKSPTRPAFHGRVMAVIQGGSEPGAVTVTASAPGMTPVSVNIPQLAPVPGFTAYWCHTEPTL